MTGIDEDLTKTVIGCFIDVSNELGHGFLESVYERSLMIAIQDAGLLAENQVGIDVGFRGKIVGQFFADIVVEKKILIEIKAQREHQKVFESQILNYLKATGLPIGFLVNFGTPRVTWKRYVF